MNGTNYKTPKKTITAGNQNAILQSVTKCYFVKLKSIPICNPNRTPLDFS